MQRPGQEVSNGASMLDEIAHVSTLEPNHGHPFLKEYWGKGGLRAVSPLELYSEKENGC